MRPHATTPQFETGAWLLRGIDTLSGTLLLVEGRLRFTAEGCGSLGTSQLASLARDSGNAGLAKALTKGGTAAVFDAPLGEIDVRFPWYYFMGGCKVRVGGHRHRLSFGQPPNGGGGTLGDAWDSLAEVRAMRKVGKALQEALQRP